MIEFDFENSVLKDVLEIKISDLDDFYVKNNEIQRSNLFFVLLNSFNFYCEKGDNKRAGYVKWKEIIEKGN